MYGWVFGQGFNSPRLHQPKNLNKWLNHAICWGFLFAVFEGWKWFEGGFWSCSTNHRIYPESFEQLNWCRPASCVRIFRRCPYFLSARLVILQALPAGIGEQKSQCAAAHRGRHTGCRCTYKKIQNVSCICFHRIQGRENLHQIERRAHPSKRKQAVASERLARCSRSCLASRLCIHW